MTELLIELQDFNLDKTYALYSAFAIGTEVEGYSISFLGSYEGDAGRETNKFRTSNKQRLESAACHTFFWKIIFIYMTTKF